VPYVEVETGVSVYVQDVGAGPPVVLIAGFGLCHEVWDDQVRLLGADHRVVCIDLRGTGRSDKPLADDVTYSIERLAQDVQVVLEDMDLRDVTLVGWSFGGQVGFQLAASAPERLARLVLVCSHGVRASRSDEFPFGAPADVLEKALVRGEIEARLQSRRSTIRSGFHGEPDADLVDWLIRCQLQMPSWAAVACYRAYLRTDLVERIADVTLPVVQIIGADDPVTRSDGARWLQERLADGRLVELADCGHYPLFEAREQFGETLVEIARPTA
jgi:pimeloyl-ACP methyl ester carboxylesterase